MYEYESYYIIIICFFSAKHTATLFQLTEIEFLLTVVDPTISNPDKQSKNLQNQFRRNVPSQKQTYIWSFQVYHSIKWYKNA